MREFSELLAQGPSHLWVYVPSAILLGALHGLEPGHSKTMMAAFVIAVRGTVGQAFLLGLCAALSHSALVFVVVLAGMSVHTGAAETFPEAYFQVISAAMMVVVAIWMLTKTYRAAKCHSRVDHNHSHAHQGSAKDFQPLDSHGSGLVPYEDAHAEAHALQIEQRFAGRSATTGQIVLFGLTGGLIPCPAAITVLLLCLQTKQIFLGFMLVLCFSLGLAVTMVSFGVAAALGSHKLVQRWPRLERLVHQAPYFSGGLIIAFGLYLGYQGLKGLSIS